MSKIDFEFSTVGSLMTRGFPLFTEFGLDFGKISNAYFELEPMYDFNIARWKEYTKNSSSVWEKKEREGPSGGYGGNRIDSPGFLESIGFDAVIRYGPYTLLEASFESIYGPTFGSCAANSYCQEAWDFAKSVGAEPPEVDFEIRSYTGPLAMRSPFTTDFFYTDPEEVKFSKVYLEALEALPETYDREAYLAFGKRFGLALHASYFEFSNTDIYVAGEQFISTGSKNYQDLECYNPEPSGITYVTTASWLVDTLSPVQKARFETMSDVTNLFDMVSSSTSSPTTFPTASPTLLHPEKSTSASPTSASPASGSNQIKLAVTCALLCTLVMQFL